MPHGGLGAVAEIIVIISPGAAQRPKPRENLCAAWGRDLGTAQEQGEWESPGKAGLYEKSWKAM